MAGTHDHQRLGFRERLRKLADNAQLYARARSQLLQIESKEAAGHGILLLVFALILLLAALLAYVLLIVGLIGFVTIRFDLAWYLVTLCTGGIHLLVAAIFALILKSTAARPLFVESRKELEKDRDWLAKKKS